MTPVDDYTARAETHRRARDAARRTTRTIGVARLLCFLVALTQVGALVYGTEPAAVAGAVLAVLVLVFVALIAKHAAIHERVHIFSALERACRDGVNRVLRRWEDLPPALELDRSPTHAFADDLHVAGAQSLARLLPPMSRPAGAAVVSEWLLAETPPPVEVIHARQSAVAELAPRAEFRETLSVLASRLAGSRTTVETFLSWAESGDRTSLVGRLRWVARLLGVITILSFFAALLQLVSPAIVTGLIVVNLIVAVAARRALNSVLDVVAGHEWRLRGLADVFRHTMSEPFDAPMLVDIKSRMGGDEAVRAFASFDRLAKYGEVRLSPMGHVVLQALTLWDVHVVDAIEDWRAAHGSRVRERLRALGELEALAALATLAYDNPSWHMPVVDGNSPIAFEATDLAHPLLTAGEGVGNDVALGAAGDILLITGSNMSGKSTLLRAIGLNAVLAQLGAPVCASMMRLSPHRVRTSIDARDALERGLSLFMAELLRIKAMVDAARAASPYPLLYIADEMLRGTNATDRHAAAVTILARLVAAGSVGVVATHDPELANDAELRPRLHPFHFIEHFDPARTSMPMWFDYKLRPGLSTTRNALKLLELVGID
jgi:hypothetical protein